jgi:hypothetical protein
MASSPIPQQSDIGERTVITPYIVYNSKIQWFGDPTGVDRMRGTGVYFLTTLPIVAQISGAAARG